MIPDRPLPGPDKADCPCGCEAFGVISKRTGHVRRVCPCKKCQGGRNRTAGLKKQRQAKKQLGVPKARFHGRDGNEENWRGAFRIEVKSGKKVGAIATHYLNAETQSENNRAEGDARPFAFVAMPEGMGSEGLVTVRLSVWRDYLVPLIEEAS